MPDCDANFPHDCDKIGYSQSSDHFNQWYCKTAYHLHLATKQAVDDRLNKMYQDEMKKIITGVKN